MSNAQDWNLMDRLHLLRRDRERAEQALEAASGRACLVQWNDEQNPAAELTKLDVTFLGVEVETNREFTPSLAAFLRSVAERLETEA